MIQLKVFFSTLSVIQVFLKHLSNDKKEKK